MIKVVSRGVDPKDYLYRMKCSTCKSVLEFQKADLKWESDYRNGGYWSLTCPMCRGSNSFDQQNLPSMRYEPEERR